MTEVMRYIGDGVYAISDGWGIWLHANNPDYPTDRVYLEPQVLTALNDFHDYLVKETNKNGKKRNHVSVSP